MGWSGNGGWLARWKFKSRPFGCAKKVQIGMGGLGGGGVGAVVGPEGGGKMGSPNYKGFLVVRHCFLAVGALHFAARNGEE